MLDKYPQPIGAPKPSGLSQGSPYIIDMATATETLDLTRLDQTVLRVYVRQLLIFPFTNAVLRKEAGAVLAAGLLATFKQFPFLAGTVEQTDPAIGALTVRYPKTINSELVSKLLTTNALDEAQLSYESLVDAGIPPVKLPANDLCPFAMRSHPGIDDTYAEVLTTFKKEQPIPVFATQMNFIPGGLILSAYTHHAVIDGTGIAKIYQIWSENTQKYSSSTVAMPEQISARSLNDARHALDTLTEGAPAAKELPEFCFPGDPRPPLLRDPPVKLIAKLLVISPSTISTLATALSKITGQRISNFTALASFVWCQATNARRAAIEAKGIKKTTLGIATDHRKRVGSLLPDDYLGNVANAMVVSAPLSSIPTAEHMDAHGIAPVALVLSNALAALDLDWFRSRLLELSKQKNPSKLMMNCHTMNGPDIFITSWQHIGADDVWAIPGTARSEDGKWVCKPIAIRKPHNLWEGGMQILPRRKGDEAPYEIPLCLEEGDMERVLRSLHEGKWVEGVIEA
ncbi:hypothetical protein N0V87_002971 [Didymella glomerata]|uniref:Uncharacterized protein n=1 Tax=Didymella glomerata TaxID=749621 RepID=A0A9W8X4N9_9PLEO|nr:hypothetical protein N0V87_002971 [Didymella glomerata]